MEDLKKTLSYNPDTGLFHWKITKGPNAKAGNIAGSFDAYGYSIIQFEAKSYKAHRLAWFFTHGYMPESIIDHIDGNRANNAISNLRLTTFSGNMQNQNKAHINNKAGFLGVSFKEKNKTNPYHARILLKGKKIHIGSFPTAELAHQAYLDKKKEVHVSFRNQ